MLICFCFVLFFTTTSIKILSFFPIFYIMFYGGGWVWRVSCHRGVQLILAYSWARPAILVAGKSVFFYFFCFFTFIPIPLSSLSLSLISSTISSISLLPFSGRWHKMTHKGWRVLKSPHNQSIFFFYFLWDHWAHLGYFENRILLGGVCNLANYSVAYEETQSNRVSDFRDFVCSLFPKAILFDFSFTLINI